LARSSFANDEILQTLFPKLFVNSGIMRKANHIFNRDVTGLRVSGTCFTNVKFIAKSSCTFFISDCRVCWGYDAAAVEVEVWLIIVRLTDDWVIYGDTQRMVMERNQRLLDSDTKRVLWKNPLSRNMPLPPESGWVPVDSIATGNPKIEYLYRTNNK
jgi:hypothetical protein